jgi:HlyD family secretion protein
MEWLQKYAKLCLLSFLFCAGCSNKHHSIPGYIEGEYTYISSGISGTLYTLAVERGQLVSQGSLLFQLDPQPEKANVEVAEANIANLKSQVDFLRRQFERQKNLYPKKATTEANLDQARTDFNSKSQQLFADQAQLIQSMWSLQQKTLYAPIGGRVFDTFYRIGENVPAHHPVLAILSPKNIQVLFYIPETLLHHIHLKQDITFSCDGCGGATHATIIYISPEAEYTPPVIYSKDTRDKLVYLVRAGMPENVANKFHPGQPIDVTIYE